MATEQDANDHDPERDEQAGDQRPGPTSGADERRGGSPEPARSQGTDDTAPTGEEAPPRPPTPLTQQIGRVVVALLAVAFGVFAVANSQFVDFSWIFGATTVETAPDGTRTSGGVPLIVLMLASAIVGLAVGGLAAWQAARSRRRREQLSDDED